MAFGVLILYPATLLNSSVNRENFISSFPIYFFFLISDVRTPSSMLNNNCERGYTCSVPNISGKHSVFFTIKRYSKCRFLYILFIKLR